MFKTPYGEARFYLVLDRYIADNAEATTLTGFYSKHCPSCGLDGSDLTEPFKCWKLSELDQKYLYEIQNDPNKFVLSVGSKQKKTLTTLFF